MFNFFLQRIGQMNDPAGNLIGISSNIVWEVHFTVLREFCSNFCPFRGFFNEPVRFSSIDIMLVQITYICLLPSHICTIC